jgi:hypothetical protein
MSMGRKGKQLASRVTAFVETPLTPVTNDRVADDRDRPRGSREAFSTLLVPSQQWLTAPFLSPQSSHLNKQSSITDQLIMSGANHFKRCPFEECESPI